MSFNLVLDPLKDLTIDYVAINMSANDASGCNLISPFTLTVFLNLWASYNFTACNQNTFKTTPANKTHINHGLEKKVHLRDARPQLDEVPAALAWGVPERGAAVVDGPRHPRHVALQRERHHAVQVLRQAGQDPGSPGW